MKRTTARFIAAETGKCESAIHRYLNGSRTPDKSTCIAWALALRLPPDALWDDQASLKPQKLQKSA